MGAFFVKPASVAPIQESGPMNCEYSDWSGWTACDLDEQGQPRPTQRRTRTILVHGGTACDQPLEDVRNCNCVTSDWTYMPCSNNKRKKVRTVLSPAYGSGLPCGPLEEEEVC